MLLKEAAQLQSAYRRYLRMTKGKSRIVKPMATLIYDLLPADVQTQLYYLTIKTKNKKGDRK
jgi:hypothetical protein